MALRELVTQFKVGDEKREPAPVVAFKPRELRPAQPLPHSSKLAVKLEANRKKIDGIYKKPETGDGKKRAA